MDKNVKLFGDFPPVSIEKWEEKIQTDLKGAPYKKLITKTIEGIDLKPYYTAEDLKNLTYLNSLPGDFPYNRSSKIKLNEWEIQQDIKVSDVKNANKKALDALNKGATSLLFIINEDLDNDKLSLLLNDIYFECVEISFYAPGQEAFIIEFLTEEIAKRNIDKNKVKGCLHFDPLGELVAKGSEKSKEAIDIKEIASLLKKSSAALPNYRLFGIKGSNFHNAGGSAVQELGFSLSVLVEYLDQLTAEGFSIDQLAPYFQFNFAAGPSYFMEIAKIRAIRLLFANLIKSYHPQSKESEKVFIHSSTSEWNQTIYDPYVNMLRGTTESMSAVLGGADSISVQPFDKAFKDSSDFSDRIARNTQIILKEEAHLNKVVDPSSGSYYIENLTDSIAEKSWNLFLETEKTGGFLNSIISGDVQNNIKETAQKRDMNIAGRREILLGTNQYPNPTEQLHKEFKAETAFPEIKDTKNLSILPLQKYRGAQAFEELRLSTAMSGNTPVVFLFNYGNVTWRKARAGFASGFFGCAGYELIDNKGFDTIDEGLKAMIKADANIIVLCSSDDEYLPLATEVAKEMNKKQILVVAGNPKDSIEELKSFGVKHFIHVRSNVLEELKEMNQVLGIN